MQVKESRVDFGQMSHKKYQLPQKTIWSKTSQVKMKQISLSLQMAPGYKPRHNKFGSAMPRVTNHLLLASMMTPEVRSELGNT
jgi:hypothetical protein